MNHVCRECKRPCPPHRNYCDNNVCGRMHAQRASKQRRGLIPPRPCALKAAMLARCNECTWPCEQCHNVAPARVCARARQVRVRGQRRIRIVCPRDCKECPCYPK